MSTDNGGFVTTFWSAILVASRGSAGTSGRLAETRGGGTGWSGRVRLIRENSGICVRIFEFGSVECSNWSDAGRSEYLMSRKMRSIRLAFTAGVVLLQLFMLPAAQLLHIGCDHTHPAGTCETPAEAASQVHRGHAHCCHHGHSHHSHGQKSSQGEPEQAPTAPHDSDSCPICQVVLAARIGELYSVQVPFSDLVVACSSPCVPDVHHVPEYRLSGRGPPA